MKTVCVQSDPCAIKSCTIGSVYNRICAQSDLCAIESVCNRVRVRLIMCAIGTFSNLRMTLNGPFNILDRIQWNSIVSEDDYKASRNIQDFEIKKTSILWRRILLIDCAQSLPRWLSLALKFIYYYYFKYRESVLIVIISIMLNNIKICK